MRVLVTGATGFIGRALVPALAAAGHEPIALVRDRSRAPEGVEALEMDLAGLAESETIPAVDAVVHLAQANVPVPDRAGELFRVNALSTQVLLEAARRAGATRFLLASSASVYGAGPHPFTEDDPTVSGSLYAASKIASEALVASYAAHLDTAVMRLVLPYGPGQTGRMLPAVAGRVRDGRPVTLNGGGRPAMNPIYVDDVVRVALGLLDSPGGRVLNVGGDRAVGIDQLAEEIGRIVDREPVFELGDPTVAGDIVVDTGRLHEALPDLRPLVDLEEGLRLTLAAPAEPG